MELLRKSGQFNFHLEPIHGVFPAWVIYLSSFENFNRTTKQDIFLLMASLYESF